MFTFPEDINIHNVAEVQGELLAFLKEAKEEVAVVLDLSSVKDMDGAGLQLLLSLTKTLKEMKRDYTFTNGGDFINKLIGLAGGAVLTEGRLVGDEQANFCSR